jgi:hypothetical protein
MKKWERWLNTHMYIKTWAHLMGYKKYEPNIEKNKLHGIRLSLQDFTVLPMDTFRRCVIRSSSVIYLPTSSSTAYVRRLSFRR